MNKEWVTAGGTVLAALITTGGVYYTKLKFWDNKKIKHEAPKLTNHTIFNSLDRKINMLENEFTIEDKGREELVRTVLTNKLKIWKKHLYNVAEDVDTYIKGHDVDNPNNNAFLENTNMKAFDSAMSEYRHFYRDLDKFTASEIEALKVFMTKFQDYHAPSVREMVSLIERFSNTTYHKGLVSKQDSIFNAYLAEFEQTVLDCEDTIAELNGDLTGYIFKGYELT